jgi:hypothetical protein
MDAYNLILEVHRRVLADHEDDAQAQAERLRESIESQTGDCSVYVESVTQEG